MDPRWIIEVPDVEAFLELLENGDIEALVAEILERANVSAEVVRDDDGFTVVSAGMRKAYELSGEELADVLQATLELAAHLVGEHGFVLAWAESDGLQIAVVPRQEWAALAEDARSGYGIVVPRARPVSPRSHSPRIRN